jgi:hypothetical protein
MFRHILVTVSAISLMAACSSSPSQPTVRSTAAGTTSESSAKSTSATPAATKSTPTPRTAAGSLGPFLAEARQADIRLRHAAALINAGILNDVVRVDQAIVNAVQAGGPDAAARAMPLGLAPELLRRTLVVYNDLVARHAAMGYFKHTGSYARAAVDAGLMLQCLANGVAPAHRFPADLGSLEQYASTRPANVAGHDDPEVRAELAVRLALISGRNRCADECGSAVFNDLEKLTWTMRPTATSAGRGELEGVGFTVTPSAQTWTVALNAC